MLISFVLFLRNFRRNRLFSFVNVLGLTAGFFTSILIYLYVQSELSYDKFHEKGERIYRVNQTFIWGDDNPNQFSSTGPGVGYSISEEIPEVDQVVRILTANDALPITLYLDGKEKFFNDEEVFAVDSNFFEVFSFSLTAGNIKTALKEPRSVILKYEAAIKFFGSTDVIGKLMTMDNGETFKVTGVLSRINQNSYLDDFDLLISMNSIPRVSRSGWNWIWTMFETYILIREDAIFENLEEKIAALPKKHAKESLEAMGYTYEEYVAAGKEWNLFLQPFTEIRLHSAHVYNRLSEAGDVKVVLALIGSAVFLLILSCINFINLSTAKFTSMAKDVALRKVLGGTKSTFIKRFFGESLAYCLISAMVAFLLLHYTIPLINQSLDTSFSFSNVDPLILGSFVAILISVTSVISGFYPFLFFNAFKPTSAMKGEFKTGNRGIGLRNGMLVVQYALSFILIVATFTIYHQLNYFRNADVGFEKENILIVENVDWTGSQEEFTDEIAKIKGVAGTSLSDSSPRYISNGAQFIPYEPDAGSIPLNFAVADENYLDLLRMELVLGRYFDKSYSSDSAAVLINETAARTIGW
ncbi:MAG: ABC transporter permease, partial [Bacteroidota bacterium]